MYGLGKGMEKDEHQQVEGDSERYCKTKAQPELHASIQEKRKEEKESERRKDKVEYRLRKVCNGL